MPGLRIGSPWRACWRARARCTAGCSIAPRWSWRCERSSSIIWPSVPITWCEMGSRPMRRTPRRGASSAIRAPIASRRARPWDWHHSHSSASRGSTSKLGFACCGSTRCSTWRPSSRSPWAFRWASRRRTSRGRSRRRCRAMRMTACGRFGTGIHSPRRSRRPGTANSRSGRRRCAVSLRSVPSARRATTWPRPTDGPLRPLAHSSPPPCSGCWEPGRCSAAYSRPATSRPVRRMSL